MPIKSLRLNKLQNLHVQSTSKYSNSETAVVENRGHPNLRRKTAIYKKKKRVVRNLWVGSLPVMLLLPLGAQLALALAVTFLGLIILDETSGQ